MAARTPEAWRQRAEAARRVAELMEDPIGREAMHDIGNACEQLASNLKLARVTRVWPEAINAETSQVQLPTDQHSVQPK